MIPMRMIATDNNRTLDILRIKDKYLILNNLLNYSVTVYQIVSLNHISSTSRKKNMLGVIIHQRKFPNLSITLCENFQLRGHEEKCFVLKFLYNLNFYYVTNKKYNKSTESYFLPF